MYEITKELIEEYLESIYAPPPDPDADTSKDGVTHYEWADDEGNQYSSWEIIAGGIHIMTGDRGIEFYYKTLDNLNQNKMTINTDNITLHEDVLKTDDFKNLFCNNWSVAVSALTQLQNAIRNPIVKLVINIVVDAGNALQTKVCAPAVVNPNQGTLPL